MARQVLENGVILPAEYSDDWYDDMTKASIRKRCNPSCRIF